MRRNIDLTDNMMFSRPHVDIRGINLRLLEKNLGRKLRLWNPNDWVSDDNKDSMIDRQAQLFPLGDRAEREFIKECKEMDSMDYCDCCGASLVMHPWDRQIGLCKRCAEQLDKEHGGRARKIPWFQVFNREQRSQRLF